jgi:hypothetical protein
MRMAKKIFNPYPHAGAALSPHADAVCPYPLSLSLDLSRRSTRTLFSEASMEHEVDVALNDVTEGWVAVGRKVALPPPPRRAARGIRLLHQGGDLLLLHGCLISSPSSWPISSPSPFVRAIFVGDIIMFK